MVQRLPSDSGSFARSRCRSRSVRCVSLHSRTTCSTSNRCKPKIRRRRTRTPTTTSMTDAPASTATPTSRSARPVDSSACSTPAFGARTSSSTALDTSTSCAIASTAGPTATPARLNTERRLLEPRHLERRHHYRQRAPGERLPWRDGITLDSWKVFPSTTNAAGTCTGFLNTTAASEASRMRSGADRVIVAEMQGSGDRHDAISVAADNAFDAGAVIIAANGNNGPGATPSTCPPSPTGHRHRRLRPRDGNQVASQSRGPTARLSLQARRPGADELRDGEHRMSFRAELHAKRHGYACLRRHEWCHAVRRRGGRARAQLPARRNRCDRSRSGLCVSDHGRADDCVHQYYGRGTFAPSRQWDVRDRAGYGEQWPNDQHSVQCGRIAEPARWRTVVARDDAADP